MKILITGATGYIGSNLVKSLVENNINQISVITRVDSDLKPLNDVIGKIKIFRYDGTEKCMMRIIGQSSPDIVCHLAGVSNYNHEISDIKNIVNSNILFGTILLDAMIKNNVFNFINTGTFWQHYEDLDYNPSCLYAATKQSFLDIIKYYVESFGLNVITLKLFDNYGPNDNRGKLFNYIDKSALENSSVKLSPGEQLIDIIHILDLIEAYNISINMLLNDNYKGQNEFFVSNKNRITLKELVKTYLLFTNQTVSIEWGSRKYRNREIMNPVFNGKILPGWSPKIDLEDGIRKLKKNN